MFRQSVKMGISRSRAACKASDINASERACAAASVPKSVRPSLTNNIAAFASGLPLPASRTASHNAAPVFVYCPFAFADASSSAARASFGLSSVSGSHDASMSLE